MDYPFFTKRLGSITASQLEKLRASVLTDASYHQHPGFKQPVDRSKVGLDQETLTEVLEQLSVFFPVDSYHTYELIKLEPGGLVAEHSDICGTYNNRLWMAAHYHKIHIPLWTNDLCYSTHRRSKHDELSYSTMAAGEVVAYNDYVWHSGKNGGDQTRVHICLAYFDPTWIYTQNIMERS